MLAREDAVAGCAVGVATVGYLRVQMRWHARAQSGAAKLAVTDDEEEAAAVDVVVVVVAVVRGAAPLQLRCPAPATGIAAPVCTCGRCKYQQQLQ